MVCCAQHDKEGSISAASLNPCLSDSQTLTSSPCIVGRPGEVTANVTQLAAIEHSSVLVGLEPIWASQGSTPARANRVGL